MPDPVTPMLDDIELTSVQWIETDERRAVVEHRIPGMAGNALQDMGRDSTTIRLTGVFFGDTALADLEALRGKFQEGTSLSFAADITTATDIIDVVIADLHVRELGGRPNTWRYRMVLRESPPPPPPIDPFGTVDLSVLDEAQGLFDQALSVVDLVANLPDIPNFGDPTVPLGGLLDEFASITGGLDLGALGDLFAEDGG